MDLHKTLWETFYYILKYIRNFFHVELYLFQRNLLERSRHSLTLSAALPRPLLFPMPGLSGAVFLQSLARLVSPASNF